MAQRILSLCDPCLHDEPPAETEGEPVMVTIGKERRVVDLCAGHRAELVTPLEKMLANFGRAEMLAPPTEKGQAAPRNGKKPQGDRSKPCLLCDKPYAAVSGLLNHYDLIHGIKTTRLGELYGTTCPECSRLGASATGLGTHVRTAHGYTGIAEAFGAMKDTDPHGVVGEVIARITKPKPAPRSGRRAAKKTATRRRT